MNRKYTATELGIIWTQLDVNKRQNILDAFDRHLKRRETTFWSFLESYLMRNQSVKI